MIAVIFNHFEEIFQDSAPATFQSFRRPWRGHRVSRKNPLFENSSDDEKENSPEKVKKVVVAYKCQLFPESLF
jgi:hypothetical protein